MGGVVSTAIDIARRAGEAAIIAARRAGEAAYIIADTTTTYCPGVGLVKAAYYGVTGNIPKAKDTFIKSVRFADFVPVVGHAKAGVHHLCNDQEGAEAAWQAAQGTLNNVPVVGHVKGYIQEGLGYKQEAEAAYKVANRATLVVGAAAAAAVTAGTAGYCMLAAAAAGQASDLWKGESAIVNTCQKLTGAQYTWGDAGIAAAGLALSLGGDCLAGYGTHGTFSNALKSTTATVAQAAEPQSLWSIITSPKQVFRVTRSFVDVHVAPILNRLVEYGRNGLIKTFFKECAGYIKECFGYLKGFKCLTQFSGKVISGKVKLISVKDHLKDLVTIRFASTLIGAAKLQSAAKVAGQTPVVPNPANAA